MAKRACRPEYEVVRATGAKSTTHPFATVWVLRDRVTGREFGTNSCDAHIRRAPWHGGAPSEPMGEQA